MDGRVGRLLWWGPTCRVWPRRHPPAPALPGPAPGPRSASAPSAPPPAAARGSVGREEGRQTFPESRDRPATEAGLGCPLVPPVPKRHPQLCKDTLPGAFELDAKQATSRGCGVTGVPAEGPLGASSFTGPPHLIPVPPHDAPPPSAPSPLHLRIQGRGRPTWDYLPGVPASHPASGLDSCPDAQPRLQPACVGL